MRLYILLLAVAVSGAFAGEARIGIPRLGYMWNSGPGELQSVEGIPGAAWISASMRLDRNLQTAVVSARQNYLLGITESGELVSAKFDLQGSTAALLPSATNVTLSAGGTAAAAYSQVDQAIVVWTGMPDNPSAHRIGLTGIDGDLSALAVSDDGGHVLATFQREGMGALYHFHENEIELVAKLKAPIAAFLPGRHTAIVADSSSGDVFAMRKSLEFVTTQSTTITAVAASADGTRLFLATPAGIRVIGLDGTGDMELQCGCSPATLERSNEANLFRLTDAARGTLWFFDGRLGKERTFFVPREVR